MPDSLIDFARKNVWCNPRQDSQYVFRPKRVTTRYGAINRIKVIDRVIGLPTSKDPYQVFQIGQIYLNTINVAEDFPTWLTDRWMTLKELMEAKSLTMMIYDEQGLVVPFSECYVMSMDEGNLVIAVKMIKGLNISVGEEDLYLRVYRNAYFNSDRFMGSETIKVFGGYMSSTSDILSLQMDFNQYNAMSGYCFCYVNGFLLDSIDLLKVTAGDYAEFIYDASVQKLVTLTLKDLRVYLSSRDGNRKYLLHYPYESTTPIEFFDDNEIFLTKNIGSGFKGIYNYHHRLGAIRMVTHRDYGVSVDDIDHLRDRLNAMVDNNQGATDEYRVRMWIRYAGYDRSLIYEDDRIHELYKLPDSKVLQTLLGTIGSLPYWRAEQLENSEYTDIMSSIQGDLSHDVCEIGLGYSSIAKYFGPGVMIVPGSGIGRTIELPPLLRVSSTVYEYDDQGLYLGHYVITNTLIHAVNHASTRYVEILKGSGQSNPELIYATETVTIPDTCNWRLYKTYLNNGAYIGDWLDITEETDLYTRDGNTITMIEQDPNLRIALKTDRTFLTGDITTIAQVGIVSFLLTEQEDRLGDVADYLMTIPYLQLDVFLNNHLLIEGIDYRVDFPRVTIISKKHLIQPAYSEEQVIHYRFYGLTDATMEMESPQDIGFVQYGYLSHNRKYDIRDDRVLRVTLDGSFKDVSELNFSEFHTGISIVNALNGLPYQIRDIPVPMREMVETDTYAFRKESLNKGQAISDYMNLQAPEPVETTSTVITERYELYSPFLSYILFHLVDGTIPLESYNHTLTSQEVLDLCQPYEEWLAIDPIVTAQSIDDRFVVVHPHHHQSVMSVNLFAYRLLLRIVELYAGVTVDLSAFVTVSTT